MQVSGVIHYYEYYINYFVCSNPTKAEMMNRHNSLSSLVILSNMPREMVSLKILTIKCSFLFFLTSKRPTTHSPGSGLVADLWIVSSWAPGFLHLKYSQHTHHIACYLLKGSVLLLTYLLPV